MRNFMQMLNGPDDAMAFVESDERYARVKEAMIALRGFDPHHEMSRSEFNAMTEMQHRFTEGLGGLEADYDVPADAIRLNILHSLRASDN